MLSREELKRKYKESRTHLREIDAPEDEGWELFHAGYDAHVKEVSVTDEELLLNEDEIKELYSEYLHEEDADLKTRLQHTSEWFAKRVAKAQLVKVLPIFNQRKQDAVEKERKTIGEKLNDIYDAAERNHKLQVLEIAIEKLINGQALNKEV